jgi:hypothetical protein
VWSERHVRRLRILRRGRSPLYMTRLEFCAVTKLKSRRLDESPDMMVIMLRQGCARSAHPESQHITMSGDSLSPRWKFCDVTIYSWRVIVVMLVVDLRRVGAWTISHVTAKSSYVITVIGILQIQNNHRDDFSNHYNGSRVASQIHRHFFGLP